MPRIDPTAVTPTQLYLNQVKLLSILEWYGREIDPEPVAVLPAAEFTDVESDWVLIDGHTRAFVTWLFGDSTIDARVATECSPIERKVYRRCLSWCREDGIDSVPDLAGRVVSDDTYDSVWIARCQLAMDDLSE